jgi:hypothetical protein
MSMVSVGFERAFDMKLLDTTRNLFLTTVKNT